MFPLRSNGLNWKIHFVFFRMARPRKNDIEKRTVQVNIRLTQDESEKANSYAKASGLSPANWIRQKVFTGKFPVMRVAPLEAEIYRELKRIGVNLNQGTHRLNQGDVPKDYQVLQSELLTLLNKIINLILYDRQSD
jgi:hypothetical protein